VNRLHHLALLATDVEGLAAFYGALFGLAEVARHTDAHGSLRSIWLELGGPLLMIERAEGQVATKPRTSSGLLLFALTVSPARRREIEQELTLRRLLLEKRTAFTSYARDPEGNDFAFSHYPELERP
jgi:catechol 2,3-dioxygenase-like lactoylglutathione lyase family enzyme